MDLEVKCAKTRPGARMELVRRAWSCCIVGLLLFLQYSGRQALGADVLPGTNVIGCGYDVLNGYYADSRSCRYNLFQFPADDWEEVSVTEGKVFRKPRAVTYQSSFGTSLEVSAGSTIREYAEDVNTKTKLEGSFLFFSSSVETDMGRSRAENSEFAFTKVQYDVRLFTLRMPPNPRDFLHPARRADIDAMPDLRQLFDLYGTHYVSELLVGGSATFSATTSKLRFASASRSDLAVAAQMSFKALSGRLAAEESRQYAERVRSFNAASFINLRTVGGDPALGGPAFADRADAWAGSVLAFPEFVNFLGERSLVGIWDLAATPERSRQLHGFYAEYCRSRETRFAPPAGPVLRAKVVPLVTTQYTDAGSGARDDIRVCRPDTGGGWFWLGQVALGNAGACEGNSLLVREMVEGSGALAEVGSWEKVWDDKGSRRKLDYNLWRGVAADPADYAVLSDFFRAGEGFNWPSRPVSREETAGIRAVRRDCLVPGVVGGYVWNDRGSRADADGSAWTVVPADASAAIPYHNIQPYFVSNGNHGRPTRPVFVLNRTAVAFDQDQRLGGFKGSLTFTHSHVSRL